MTIPEISAAIGGDVFLTRSNESTCQWLEARFAAAPPGIRVSASEDTIVRIDIDSAGPRTLEGIKVGSSIDEILSKYDTLISRDVSLDGEPFFTLKSTEPEHAFLIVFRTDGALVRTITIGRRWASQVEECG